MYFFVNVLLHYYLIIKIYIIILLIDYYYIIIIIYIIRLFNLYMYLIMQNNFQVCVCLISEVYCMYSYQKVQSLVPFDFLSDFQIFIFLASNQIFVSFVPGV